MIGCRLFRMAREARVHTGILAEDICAEPLAIADGRIELPSGPGFGVVLDEDKIDFPVRQTGR
jgi:L-alanine-DL-glutamate epimerase-like enolase superfamily enzyme